MEGLLTGHHRAGEGEGASRPALECENMCEVKSRAGQSEHRAGQRSGMLGGSSSRTRQQWWKGRGGTGNLGRECACERGAGSV